MPEHDPEKRVLDPIEDGTGFRKRSCSNERVVFTDEIESAVPGGLRHLGGFLFGREPPFRSELIDEVWQMLAQA